jgi:hypothetical protein
MLKELFACCLLVVATSSPIKKNIDTKTKANKSEQKRTVVR